MRRIALMRDQKMRSISQYKRRSTGRSHADGRPLKEAELRFEQREGQVSPIISRTDANGHYTAALPRGVYKLTLATAGKARASITVRATGARSRIDFDLSPSAAKKIKDYVWAGEGTGSHLPGHWVEVRH